MSYGELIENTLIRLNVEHQAKVRTNFLVHRKAMIEGMLKDYSTGMNAQLKWDYEIQCIEIPREIECLENLMKSVKPFLIEFYN